MRDQLQQLAAILARWWHLVASNKTLNLLHRAMCTVTYRRVAMAIKTATFYGDLLIVVCLPVALVAAGVIRSK
jgi:hypothetical protein